MVKQTSGKDSPSDPGPVREQKSRRRVADPMKSYPNSKALLTAFKLARDANITYS